MAGVNERRKRVRVALQWPVRLSKSGMGETLHTTTRNLSSAGFYCVASDSFLPGDRLDCTIIIPPEALGYSEDRLCLQCYAEVARVEFLGAEGFGIACRIEDYAVLHVGPATPSDLSCSSIVAA